MCRLQGSRQDAQTPFPGGTGSRAAATANSLFPVRGFARSALGSVVFRLLFSCDFFVNDHGFVHLVDSSIYDPLLALPPPTAAVYLFGLP